MTSMRTWTGGDEASGQTGAPTSCLELASAAWKRYFSLSGDQAAEPDVFTQMRDALAELQSELDVESADLLEGVREAAVHDSEELMLVLVEDDITYHELCLSVMRGHFDALANLLLTLDSLNAAESRGGFARRASERRQDLNTVLTVNMARFLKQRGGEASLSTVQETYRGLVGLREYSERAHQATCEAIGSLRRLDALAQARVAVCASLTYVHRAAWWLSEHVRGEG